jgi:poly(3-hydroxybutyrate) depolymerase
MNQRILLLASVLVASMGCGGPDDPSTNRPSDLDQDASADHVAPHDSSENDAFVVDAEARDRSEPDAFAPDADSPDASVIDSAIDDVSEVDSAIVDAPVDDVMSADVVVADRPDGSVVDVITPDVVADRPEVAVDVPVMVDVPVDRPDVTVIDATVDVPVDRPDVTVIDATVDVPVDRPDVTVIDATVDVPVDRPDVSVIDATMDVPVDRPDVTVIDATVDVPVDRPDTTVVDVPVDTVVDVPVDRPDTTVVDVPVDTVVDAPLDRPDTTVVDVPVDLPADASSTIPPDPVAYVGTFSTRTDGRSFLLPMRVLGNRRDVWIQMPVTLGPNPALMLAFHGTNGDGAVMLSDSGASTVIASNNVIFIAPTSRWFGGEGADFDHPGGNGTYWETANNPNPDTNEDLLLVRAIIQEARRAYNIDPARVYAYGHSNGGFMAYMVAQVLRERVVGFGENSAGLSRCNPQQSCRFQGVGTTCAALSTQSGWCACAGPELPVPVPTTGRHGPAILLHGTADPLVSVYHTCTLETLLRTRGHPVSVTLFDGGGHFLSATVAQRVWTYLSPFRMP